MSKAILTIGIIILGIFAFAGINLISNYSMGTEMDYYTLKETVQGAMTDAADYSYYRKNGTVRMDREKFTESFMLRLAKSVSTDREYNIKIYDVNEVPPKVSVQVEASNLSTNPNTPADQRNAVVVTRVDGILASGSHYEPVSHAYKNGSQLVGTE